MENFTYKSYCWSLGTTSFRTENFNKNIELQLKLLNDFWQLPKNIGQEWIGNRILQSNYYDFLKDNGFVVGIANNKDKDARQKTSGLVDIGLIDNNRKLTEVGYKLLQVSESRDFSTDNLLQISKDSFIYLKQLLKTNIIVENECVKPFIIALYLLNKHQFLEYDEFVYLLPLCTNKKYTEQILIQISYLRNNKINIDDIIIKRLMEMENYQEALKWFLDSKQINKDVICKIGMNRKSPSYDLDYFEVYEILKAIFLQKQKDEDSLIKLYNIIRKLKLKTLWSKFIFTTKITTKKIKKELCNVLNPSIFDKVSSEDEFKVAFFKVLHLLKAKATLRDYADLNRRYLGLSNIFLFKNNKVELDIIPKYFFKPAIEDLYKNAFISDKNLYKDCELNEISSSFVSNDNIIIDSVNTEFGLNISTLDDAMSEYEKQKYERFNKLIDEKFNDEKLVELLNSLETREDKVIKEYITNNADVPTIYEYLLGIIWYKISERKGKILDYMKLSMDADFLPISHAGGGEADIVYEYEESEFYPQHALLLEATLTDKTNQRRAEMEPVSRHLGQHLLATRNINSYCVFSTTHLDINVLSDFRNRKNSTYYDTCDSTNKIKGMKIIPLETIELKNIIKNNKKYSELYSLFDEAYKANLDELDADEWYERYIKEKLKN
ncbi:AlwI family type II restriction endonuclease [Campylobacter lari]|nr:AlwI family type II restriction endonuclease [Campylobacter lari]